MFLLCHATFAWRGTFLRVMANSFRHSLLSWIQNFTMSFPFHHATFAWWNTFLQVAANFLLDPLFPWVLSFIFWWCSAAILQTLCRFLGSLTGITGDSTLGIS
jgi:hypothetical protein